MKILEVYDKNSVLGCYGKNVFKTMNEFFSRFPREYGECYYDNLEMLKIMVTDNCYGSVATGGYHEESNTIIIQDYNSLGHELMHVAQYDRINKKSSIEVGDGMFERGLVEGVTEYLTMMAYGMSGTDSYPFEVFAVSMLDNGNVPFLFRPFFIPNHEEFIKLFPNRRDIYSLMYSLNYYFENMFDYMESVENHKDTMFDILLIRNAIRDTIDSLISIELSLEKDSIGLRMYEEKFMDLISSSDVAEDLKIFDPKYMVYAEKEIKKRIRKK